MRQDGLFKHLAICAVMAVVFYVAAFSWIQHRRTFKGPWVVDFRADAAGAPSIVISQANLQISETIAFPGKTVRPANSSRTLVFDQRPPALPFGELLFQDPIYLPGTVTLRLFGHQVEILPRTLIVDKREYHWKSGAVVEVR